MKTNHLDNAGPARGKQLAHGHNRPARPERKEERGGLAGLRPTTARPGRPGWLAEVEASPVCALARRRGSTTRPAAIFGHGRASARDVRGDGECGRVARLGGRREGRRLPWRPSTAAPWPSVARRGEARPMLGGRRKRDLKEGEAELRARGIGEWRGGAGARRRRSCGRGECRAWGSRLWRRKKAARAGVSERTGCGS